MDGREDDEVLTPFRDDELREVAQLLTGGGTGEEGDIQDLVLSSEVIGEKTQALDKEVHDVEEEVLQECL